LRSRLAALEFKGFKSTSFSISAQFKDYALKKRYPTLNMSSNYILNAKNEQFYKHLLKLSIVVEEIKII